MIHSLLEPVFLTVLLLFLMTFPLLGFLHTPSIKGLPKIILLISCNLTALYLLVWFCYLLSVPPRGGVFFFGLLTILSLFRAYRKDKFSELKGLAFWRGLLCWGGMIFWILALQSQIVVYGAGGWFGDWCEHWERALFFLDQKPLDTRFLYHVWNLPARAPLFNGAAAFFMSLFGRDFWVYQIVSTLFNTLPVLPLSLLIQKSTGWKEYSSLLAGGILMGVAPFAVQHELYCWTKFLTLFFLLGGLYFYWLSSVEKKTSHPWWSFFLFSGAILTHYMAVPFVVLFGLHYLWSVPRTSGTLKKIAYPLLIGFLLLGSWFLPLMAVFGFSKVLKAPSSINLKVSVRMSFFQAYGEEVYSSILPYTLRLSKKDREGIYGQQERQISEIVKGALFQKERSFPSFWWWFHVQNLQSFLGCLGVAGCLGLMIALGIRKGKDEKKGPLFFQEGLGRLFWLGLLLSGFLLISALTARHHQVIGLSVPGGPGTAHLSSFVFISLLFVFILSCFSRFPKVLRILLVGIFLVESLISSTGLVALQSRPVPYFPEAKHQSFLFQITLNYDPGKTKLEVVYLKNFLYKYQSRALYLSDHLGEYKNPFFFFSLFLSLGLFWLLRRKKRE